VLKHSPAERDDLSHFREAVYFFKKAYAALKNPNKKEGNLFCFYFSTFSRFGTLFLKAY